MPIGWHTCTICGRTYSGLVAGDCGSQDEQHRKARGDED